MQHRFLAGDSNQTQNIKFRQVFQGRTLGGTRAARRSSAQWVSTQQAESAPGSSLQVKTWQDCPNRESFGRFQFAKDVVHLNRRNFMNFVWRSCSQSKRHPFTQSKIHWQQTVTLLVFYPFLLLSLIFDQCCLDLFAIPIHRAQVATHLEGLEIHEKTCYSRSGRRFWHRYWQVDRYSNSSIVSLVLPSLMPRHVGLRKVCCTSRKFYRFLFGALERPGVSGCEAKAHGAPGWGSKWPLQKKNK